MEENATYAGRGRRAVDVWEKLDLRDAKRAPRPQDGEGNKEHEEGKREDMVRRTGQEEDNRSRSQNDVP